MESHIPHLNQKSDDFPINADESPRVLVFHPRIDDLILRNFWRFSLGAMIGFGICVEFYKRALGILPAPHLPLLISAAGGAAIGLLFPRRRVWRKIQIDEECLILTDLRGYQESMRLKDVRLITGEAGISLDGGEMLLWKWVRVATLQAGYKLKMLGQSEALYIALLQNCPSAIGISYSGTVHIPVQSATQMSARSQNAALVDMQSRRQARVAMLCAGLLAAISLALGALLPLAWKNAPSENHDSLARLTMYAIILGVLTVLIAAHAARRYLLGRRVAERVRVASPVIREAHTPHHLTIAANK